MPKTNQKNAHGGKRAGAGRKPIAGETVLIAARIPIKLRDRLDKLAKAKGVSRSQVIVEAIKLLR